MENATFQKEKGSTKILRHRFWNFFQLFTMLSGNFKSIQE